MTIYNKSIYTNKTKLNKLIWFCFLILIQSKMIHSLFFKDISVQLLANAHYMRLQINWNKKNMIDSSKVDITVVPVSQHCHQGVCIADGISAGLEEIILPKHAPSVANTTPECSIDPGCKYLIKIEAQDHHISRNSTFHVPDCINLINYVCTCRTTYLPELTVSGKLINNYDSILINWNLKKIFDNIKLLNITKIQVITTIYNKTNPSLSWGGILQSLGTYKFLIEKNALNANDTKLITGFKVHKLKAIASYGQHFLIDGQILDNRDCLGKRHKYTLIVPNTKTESINSGSLQLKILSITISILIIILIIFIALNHLYKRFKKSQTEITSNWRSVYRNTSSGENRPISMEVNLLYLDKDILDAQEKGKADIFEIPHNSIKISQEIGKGAFGRVFKASVQNLHRKPGQTIVAVKQLKKKPLAAEIEEFLSEIQTMKNVGYNENIVTLLGCCTIKEPYMMIMEYVGHGDLLQYLRNIRKKHLSTMSKQNSLNVITNTRSYEKFFNNNCSDEITTLTQGKYLELQFSTGSNKSDKSSITQAETNSPSNLRPSLTETTYTMLSQLTKPHSEQSSTDDDISDTLDYVLDNTELHNFALQIAKGMKHLEEKGITHRDLAARNVLIDKHKTLKISDFGLSRPGIYVKPRDKAKLLPLRWLSIEAIHDNLYSSKSDVWAFGIVLWEIGTLGGFPYSTLNNHELLQFLFSGKRLDKPEICTDNLYELMLKCWHEDPDKRPSFSQILCILKSQNQKIYVNFNDLGLDYVFPPLKEQITSDIILNQIQEEN